MLSLESLEDRRLLATFTVTTNVDGPVAAAGDLPGSLRQAIFDANTNPSDDTIAFDSAVFTGGDASLVRLTAGELEITDTLTIDGSTGTNVTITGDANGDDITDSANITDVEASYGGTLGATDDLLDDNSRVLNFSAATGDLNLNGVTITGGRTTGNNARLGLDTTYNGGGIRIVTSGTVSLVNSKISGNSTAGSRANGAGVAFSGALFVSSSVVSENRTAGYLAYGGGLHSSSGDVSLINSVVSENNTAGDRAGGGGISTFSGNVTLSNSTVSGNWSDNDGGGILTGLGNVSLANSTVSDNSTRGSAAPGGGIKTYSGNISLYNSALTGNSTIERLSNGGGIMTRSGNVSLTNSTVSGNSVNGSFSDGGGIFSGGASVSLTNSTVSGNSSARDQGGGIYADYAVVLLFESTISGNSADESGGGIHIRYGDVLLTNSTLSGNSANDDGGGIYSYVGNVLLNNSTLSGNWANGGTGGGGGIFAFRGDVSLSSSTISGNSTSGFSAKGGGINSLRGSIYATNSTISGNSTSGNTANGGGLYTYSGNVSAINSTISGNSVTGNDADGGGIWTYLSEVLIANSTVTNNSAGGIVGGIGFAGDNSDASLTITNSIVADNADNGTAPDLRPDPSGVLTIDHSLIGSTIGSGIEGSTGIGNLLNMDPLLGPLAFNGGQTKTHALLPGSPAIGAGNGLATVTVPGVFSTGNADMHYELIGQPGTGLNDQPVNPETGWVTSSTANWISVDQFAIAPVGTYIYRTTFDLSSFDLSSVVLAGQWASDDEGIDIQINGVSTGFANDGPGILVNFTIDDGFVSGINTLDFVVSNVGENDNLTGLIVDHLTATGILALEQRGFDRVVDGQMDIGAFERQVIEPIVAPPVVTSVLRDEGVVLERPDLLSTFAVSFDVDVNVSADDLVIRNDTLDGTVVDSSGLTLDYDSTTHTATWDFGSLNLDPAFYSFELSSDIVSVDSNLSLDGDFNGNPGGAFIESIYVALPGDANLDGQVDVLEDAFALVENLGTTGGATWVQGDFNDDGSVDVLGDAFLLVGRLGQSVVPPAMVMASTATSADSEARATEVFSTSPVVVDLGSSESLSNSREENGRPRSMSSPPRQLELAGSQDLDEVFESSNLIDDSLF